jgi:hypothetical protein
MYDDNVCDSAAGAGQGERRSWRLTFRSIISVGKMARPQHCSCRSELLCPSDRHGQTGRAAQPPMAARAAMRLHLTNSRERLRRADDAAEHVVLPAAEPRLGPPKSIEFSLNSSSL